MAADRADEADLSHPPLHSVDTGRPVIPISATVDRFERSEGFNPFPDGCIGKIEAVILDPCMSQRHQLDETDLIGMLQRQTCKVQNLVVVKPLDGHNVDLDRSESGFPDLHDPPQNSADISSAGDPGVLFSVEGIKADIDPPNSRPEETFRKVFEKDAVRCQADVRQFRDRMQRGCELHDAPTDQRLAPGDSDFCNPCLCGNPDDPVDLFIAKNVVVTDPGQSLLRHAVCTAEVAPVGD